MKMNKQYSAKKAMRGFTLIELLIVMIIIGLLASLVGPAMFGRVDSSRVTTAEAQMKLLQTALDTYRLDMGTYPDDLDELRESDKRLWKGPYFPKEIPLDPWENPYVYEKTADGFALLSLGADGERGGEENDADVEL